MKYKENILKLRAEGKSYRDIQKILGCSRGLIAYHCSPNMEYRKQLNKERQRAYRAKHPFIKKLQSYKDREYNPIFRKHSMSNNKLMKKKVHTFTGEESMKNPPFTIDDVINKFGTNPKCYLTGDDINIYEPRTYNFDHIIPISVGGASTLDNLGICTKRANQSKSDMTPEQYLNHCKKVLEYQGYKVLNPN